MIRRMDTRCRTYAILVAPHCALLPVRYCFAFPCAEPWHYIADAEEPACRPFLPTPTNDATRLPPVVVSLTPPGSLHTASKP
jgi:hypothetical protein